MRERVAAAGGRLTIERGQEGGGWTVAARLSPFPTGDAQEATSVIEMSAA
jgi:signal transduction histidine kinase